MKLCECGCGEPAPLAKQTDRKRGHVKGEPLRFVMNHHRRGARLTPEHARALLEGRIAAPMPEDARRRISESRLAERHPLWQGDAADYNTIHQWVSRNHPKTGRCEWCGTTAATEYAFLAGGRECTRDRADYAELCVPCHRRHDHRLKKARDLAHDGEITCATC